MKNFLEWSIESQNAQLEGLFNIHPGMNPPPPPRPRPQQMQGVQISSPGEQERDQARSKKRIFQIWAKIATQTDLSYDMARRKILRILDQHKQDFSGALTDIIKMLRVELPPVYRQISDQSVGQLPPAVPPPARKVV